MSRFFHFLWRLVGGRDVIQDARRITDATRAVKARRPEAPTPSELSASEAFAQAVQEYGRTEADLNNLHRHHTARCHVLAAGALFALAYGVTTTCLTQGAWIGVWALWLAPWFLAGAAQSSLRAWQLHERRLGSLREWVRQPRGWFPPISIY